MTGNIKKKTKNDKKLPETLKKDPKRLKPTKNVKKRPEMLKNDQKC